MRQLSKTDLGITGVSGQLHRFLTQAWRLQPLYVSLYAILLSFLIGGILISVIGVNPLTAYWALLRGMVGDGNKLAGSLARSVPFIGSALALAFAFRAGLFNIGAEGQLLAGGLTAAYVGALSWMGNLPGILTIPLILMAGTLGGAIWGGIPGVLRTKTGAHEVISTIMLNSVVLFVARWMVGSRDPVVLRDTESTVPRTKTISDTAVLPELVDSLPTLHFGLLALTGLCFVVAFINNRTSLGFEIQTVGLNPHAAHYAGMNVHRVIVLTMAASGAFAGLAAASEISGTSGYFQPGTFFLMGFDGIAIALLARTQPIAIIAASLLWGSMLSGAPLMQQEANMSIDVVRIIQALVLLFVAADAMVRYLFKVRKQDQSPFQANTIGATL
ncbi:MAG: ABC transporter permease [Acidimicrobiia bacterium]|nr:ABC transporter permease [Acidimicrobiia bacterium]MYC57750.1 ABC transporter permease [Acidimicrobiia bacterium]MYI31299.1 ABC transporter permease [Acidimicrobiia bacterium]